MSYSAKEIFYTLQGEGANAGRPAVFCRFAGCNLWSGHEADRATATCQFCDTDFVGIDGKGGGKFATASELAAAIARNWPEGGAGRKLVVFTGGEPLLQLDAQAVDALQRLGFEVAVETNGTLEPPANVDWLCVSPKAGAELRVRRGHELKVVYPQLGLDPRNLVTLEFAHFYVQPMDGPRLAENTRAAVAFCLENPAWRLSLQTHKLLGIP